MKRAQVTNHSSSSSSEPASGSLGNLVTSSKAQLDSCVTRNAGRASSGLSGRLLRAMASRVFVYTACALLLISSLVLFTSRLPSYNDVLENGPWGHWFGEQSPLQTNGYIIVSGDDEPPLDVQRTQRKHVIIFDGGSTGTRVHVFTFQIKPPRDTTVAVKAQRKRIILKSEDFKSTTPGLSSYAEQPERAADSVRQLLMFAGDIVPNEQRCNTSLSLIATAGLRLLPDKQSTAILDQIEQMLHSQSPKYKMHDDSIKILDGNSEGVFGWVTINFLLKRLHSTRRSVAVLDLGGGSTQITFAPRSQETLDRTPSNFIVHQDILGKRERLYTHSYLGYGLMAARQALLLKALESVSGRASRSFAAHDHVNVSHPCFAAGQTRSWHYAYVNYAVTGVGGDCYAFIRNYFDSRKDLQNADELNDRDIYAISYFYDRMVDVGVITRANHVAEVHVRDFYLAARFVCGDQFDQEKRQKRFKQPWRTERERQFNLSTGSSEFLCLDFTYITHLLRTGYRMRWDKQITIGKRINNVELSWALGAAFSLLDVD
jgi:ectonucleoside triphosphate diphosphohydrolase 5/6